MKKKFIKFAIVGAIAIIGTVGYNFTVNQDDANFQFSMDNIDALAQGEGISLLLRAYQATSDIQYLHTAELAYQYLVKPLTEGGVAQIKNTGLFLYEYTHKPLVLNGFIFAIWGIVHGKHNKHRERGRRFRAPGGLPAINC